MCTVLEIFPNSFESHTTTTDTAFNATHSHSHRVASYLVYCYFRNRRGGNADIADESPPFLFYFV